MRYHIITFGCQMNKSDSERIAKVLESIGYEKTSTENEADLILVNMCSVRQSAVDRVYGLSRKFQKLKNKNPKLKTVLTGCVLKEDFKKFKNIFDFILSIKTLSLWPEILKQNQYCWYFNPRDEKFIQKFSDFYLKEKPSYSNPFLAFIPISIGCNNFCTYCVVPFTRGPLICRNHKEILNEIKEVVQNGAKEIWLLGQNVNDYHSPTDISVDFSKLLKMVNNIEGDFWIRFASSNPKDFSDELIDTMANCKKVTEYLNLPVQSGDNEILKKMNRFYTVEEYKNLVRKIRERIPDIALSTDVIVGFPGETKAQFENTVSLFKEIKFDMAYIAKYSPRPHTAARRLKDDVPLKEKKGRYKILTEILKETAFKNNKKYVGKEVEVLVEKQETRNKKQVYFGRTRTYKTVKLQTTNHELQTNLIGQFIKVKITDSLPWGLKGKFIS